MGKLPEDYERDFVSRTIKNLKIIEESAATRGEGYEVTQLVNSLLGLVVMLKEREANQAWQKMSIDDPRVLYLPPPEVHYGSRVKKLGEFIRLVRNGITHFNIDFLDDGLEIIGLKISNFSEGRLTHSIQFDVRQLREFACRFPLLIEQTLTE